MSKTIQAAPQAAQAPQARVNQLANQTSRSMIAVIDAICQRGGFRGEELTTIGQLRDQCIQTIQLIESLDQEEAEVDTQTFS